MAYLLLVVILVFSACSRTEPEQASGYIDSRACAGCHPQIANSYRETGMARAFHKIQPEEVPTASYTHDKSGRTYSFLTREGKVFLKRGEVEGLPAVEKEIHYVLGSGNHARSFLHRTPEGRLLEMPVNWYPDKGGFVAMSPGYDRADHFDMRRAIGYQCAFCHNGYPKSAGGSLLEDPVFEGELPEGIDCQRCHGPGREHVASGGRGVILNPKKLSSSRQMEVCMQCHLETTSYSLPNSIVKLDRKIFTYNPAESLTNFIQHYDHARNTGHDDKFEIASSAYRLRQSKCFRLSDGKMTCTTCHNPHEKTNTVAVDRACQQCHPNLAAIPNHAGRQECASCHMPQRRTEDVIHVAVTDHKIQRPDPRANLLAAREERHEVMGKDSYQGEVMPYYPAQPDSDLYPALAQVIHQSNLEKGVPRLEAALAKEKPQQPGFYIYLAQALHAAGKGEKAPAAYQQALALDGKYLPALRNLGASQLRAGDLTAAKATLEKAVAENAKDSLSWLELARVQHQQRSLADAAAAARKAVAAEPELVEAHKLLAAILTDMGDRVGAEKALREGLSQQPDEAEMRASLANLAMQRGAVAEAEQHFRAATRSAPNLRAARFNYALFLAQQGRYPEAIPQAQAAVQLDGKHLESLDLLASLQMAVRDFRAAADLYRRALAQSPAHPRALLGLGTALGAANDFRGARDYLTQAANSSDPAVQAEARELLGSLPR